MKYCINVARGEHEGGTKFYDIWGLIIESELTNAEPRIVLIQNWGKVNSYRVGTHALSGQYKINHFGKSDGADVYYKTIKMNKEGRGYSFNDSVTLFESQKRTEFWNKVLELKIDNSYLEDIYRHLFDVVMPVSEPQTNPQTNTSSTEFKDKSINDPLWGIW